MRQRRIWRRKFRRGWHAAIQPGKMVEMAETVRTAKWLNDLNNLTLPTVKLLRVIFFEKIFCLEIFGTTIVVINIFLLLRREI